MLEIMTASYGYAWSPKSVTLSSVGLKKGLQRFIEESDCHLAISLHSPIPLQRRELMPAEKAFSITEILELLRNFDFSKQRRLSFEYIVFKGVNDSLPYSGKQTVRSQIITERSHGFHISPFKIHSRYGMKTNQVNPAVQPA